MSRKPFIAGNWKMNKNPEEAKAFVEAVAAKLPSSDLVEAGIAAPALDLTTVLAAAKGRGRGGAGKGGLAAKSAPFCAAPALVFGAGAGFFTIPTKIFEKK